MSQKIRCPFCFERFYVDVHVEEGENQAFVVDCEVCCHPIDIHAHWNGERAKFQLDVQRSSGF